MQISSNISNEEIKSLQKSFYEYFETGYAFEDFLKEYNRINEVYDKLKNEIQTLEILETDFKNYRDTIYKYFIYTHRSDELTA